MLDIMEYSDTDDDDERYTKYSNLNQSKPQQQPQSLQNSVINNNNFGRDIINNYGIPSLTDPTAKKRFCWNWILKNYGFGKKHIFLIELFHVDKAIDFIQILRKHIQISKKYVHEAGLILPTNIFIHEAGLNIRMHQDHHHFISLKVDDVIIHSTYFRNNNYQLDMIIKVLNDNNQDISIIIATKSINFQSRPQIEDLVLRARQKIEDLNSIQYLNMLWFVDTSRKNKGAKKKICFGRMYIQIYKYSSNIYIYLSNISVCVST